MRSVQKSLRIPLKTVRSIQELADAADRDFSRTTNELLEEAIRMRRCPGIVFTSGPAGRRATIAGTGLDVWEVVAKTRARGSDVRRLRRYYSWLPESQIRSALTYYQLYPEEIDARLRREEAMTPAAVYGRHPAIKPSLALRRRRPRHGR